MNSETRYVARHSDEPSSRGSRTYNTLYAELSLNAVYLQFAGVSAAGFLGAMKALGFVGSTIVGRMSSEIVPLLDDLDSSAAAAGAVNTVVYRNGHAMGFKTDGPALVNGLREVTDLDGKSVAIAGAGHLVREIVPLLANERVGAIRLYNRTESTGRNEATSLGVDFGGTLDNLSRASADVLINATPVGARWCNTSELIPASDVSNFGAVLDTSFDPAETELVKSARSSGVPVTDGLRMFAYQGAMQVEHYFGHRPTISRVEALIAEELKE